MSKKLEISDLVQLILEEDIKNSQEETEIIHMLLDSTVSQNTNTSHTETLSFGARISDKMSSIVGSWAFILTFCAILFSWIVLNSLLLLKAFDPFPFILLNLALSCVAALQAPILMMSQNRQEGKDRIRAENDYKVNLKSELILKDLHLKLDQLITNHEQIVLRLDAMDSKKL